MEGDNSGNKKIKKTHVMGKGKGIVIQEGKSMQITDSTSEDTCMESDSTAYESTDDSGKTISVGADIQMNETMEGILDMKEWKKRKEIRSGKKKIKPRRRRLRQEDEGAGKKGKEQGMEETEIKKISLLDFLPHRLMNARHRLDQPSTKNGSPRCKGMGHLNIDLQKEARKAQEVTVATGRKVYPERLDQKG